MLRDKNRQLWPRLWQHRPEVLLEPSKTLPTFEEDLETMNSATENYVNSFLTAKPVNVNSEIDKLFKACCSNDLQTIKNVISGKEASVDDIVDSNGNTLLHIAAWMGNIEAVKFLLQNGAKIVNNMENKTALDLASQNKHYNITKVFTMRQLIKSSDRLSQSTNEFTQHKSKPKKLTSKTNSKSPSRQEITSLYRTCEGQQEEDEIILMKEKKLSITYLSVNKEDHQLFFCGVNVETSKTPSHHVSWQARSDGNTVKTAKKKDFETVTCSQKDNLELEKWLKLMSLTKQRKLLYQVNHLRWVRRLLHERLKLIYNDFTDGQKSRSISKTQNQMKRKSSSLEEIDKLSVKNFKSCDDLHQACEEKREEDAIVLIQEDTTLICFLNQENGNQMKRKCSSLEKTEELSVKNVKLCHDLHQACKEKREEDAIVLIREDKTLIWCLNQENETPLHVACRNGLYKVVKELISNGADIEAKNRFEETPLYWASWNGHNEVVKFLLAKKADVNSKAKCGYTPLFKACYNEHFETIKILYDNGADLIIEDDDLCTPLHIACSLKNLEIVRFLVEKGAKINVLNVFQDTPLHIACEKGDFEIVKFLLENGAKVDVIDNKGRTPLRIAQHGKHMEIIKLMLNYTEV